MRFKLFLMLCGLLMSLGLIALGPLDTGVKTGAEKIIQSIDFNDLLLHGMLSFLLFAGALHVNINDLLKRATEQGASDLHLKVGSYPVIRIDGKLRPMTDQKRLMQEDTIAMAFSIMSARQKQKFKENLEIDIAYSVPGLGRFRCNVFKQRGTVGLVLRVIPVKIMTAESDSATQ